MFAQDFIDELNKVNTFIENSYDQLLSVYGLSYARWQVIRAVVENGEKARPSLIASRLGLTKSTISSLVNALELDGIVGRRPCVKDGRQICVYLTTSGLKLAHEIIPIIDRHTADLFKLVSTKDIQSIMKAFYVLRQHAREEGVAE